MYEFDAKLKLMDQENKKTTFTLHNGEDIELEGAASIPFHEVGQVGTLEYEILTDGASRFRFHAYPDQRLRRAHQLDEIDFTDASLTRFGWEIDGRTFTCRAGVTPGKDGRFIADETEPLTLSIPPEFAELCERRGWSPEQVLRGFIADLAELQNYIVNPREDLYSSNGSDERRLAEEWFDRAYMPFDEDFTYE